MKQLQKCPVCKSRLDDNGKGIQFCGTCGYWVRKGTARLDSSIMIA
ncbi:MAG: hypothetical protein JW705_03585 [Methanosarcinaceae archaeon]|nr:hypothetical protein [Methanosarcinaceae archaeon]